MAGTTYEVDFESVTEVVNHQVDDVYRRKYGKSSCLASMFGERTRAATVRVTLLSGPQ